MKAITSVIDLHVVVAGIMLSLVIIGLVSVITFVPSPDPLLPAMTIGLLPLLGILGPMVATRARDKWKQGANACRYAIVNLGVAMAIGLFTGLTTYGMMPRT
jgi:hypothetical protein